MTDFPASVEDFRARVNTDVGDTALQARLYAAEQAIRARFPETDGTETHDGGQSYIFLRRRASTITTVTETVHGTETELDPTGFRLRDDGVSLLRLNHGLNPPTWRSHTLSSAPWGHLVTVEYEPADDAAELARVQIALVELDVNAMPGLTSETIGSWSEQANSGIPYATEREAILASLALTPAPGWA